MRTKQEQREFAELLERCRKAEQKAAVIESLAAAIWTEIKEEVQAVVAEEVESQVADLQIST